MKEIFYIMQQATPKQIRDLRKKGLIEVYLTREQCHGKPGIDETVTTVYRLTRKGEREANPLFTDEDTKVGGTTID